MGTYPFDVRIPPEYKEEFFREFIEKYKVEYTVGIENLQVLLDKEIKELENRVVYDSLNETTEQQFF